MSLLVWLVILVLVGMLFSGFFSGAETGAYLFNRTRLRLALAEGSRRAHMVRDLTGDLTGLVVVCLIGTNLSNNLVSYSATLAFEELKLTAPELIATLTVGPILFLLGELAPKELFRRHPDRLLYGSAPGIRLAAALFRPLTWALGGVTWLLDRIGLKAEEGRGPSGGEARLRQAIAAGHDMGTLTAYQTTLARNIFSLRTRTVRHAMVPLAEVDCLEAATDLEEARSFVRNRGRARFPVYCHKRERVIGVVNLFDLLFEERPGLTIRNYIQPAEVVAPEERVAEALVRLRRGRTNLAVVTANERALGIITLKDLVEEITGELNDL